jgi:hypothetical protein
MFQTNRRRLIVEIHLAIQVTPIELEDCSRVLIRAYPYNPTVLGDGYVLLNQVIAVNQPTDFASAHTYVLDTLAKICHGIADEVEEAGYTAIGDLMLKLSEHK